MPKLSHENEHFITHIYSRIAPGLFGAMGSFNYGAIELVLDKYVEPADHMAAMDKVLIIINAIREVREKERNA